MEMITDKYILEHKTSTLKKGDKVVMKNCIEAEYEKNKIYTCITDSFVDKSNTEVVFLDGFSGSFLTKYLSNK